MYDYVQSTRNDGYSRLPTKKESYLRDFLATQSFGPNAADQLAISCELISWMQPGESWTDAAFFIEPVDLVLRLEYVRKNILVERHGF